MALAQPMVARVYVSDGNSLGLPHPGQTATRTVRRPCRN